MRNTADDIEEAAHRFEQLADELDSSTAEVDLTDDLRQFAAVPDAWAFTASLRGSFRPALPTDHAAGDVATLPPLVIAERIRVYTCGMRIVKVRRVGNSNVVSLPRELEASGYAPGTSVLIEELKSGELRIIPTDQVRERIRAVGQRIVADHGEALKILADHNSTAADPVSP